VSTNSDTRPLPLGIDENRRADLGLDGRGSHEIDHGHGFADPLRSARQQGETPAHLSHQDRYAVRSGACVTNKAKDLPAVMVERFGEATGFVGRPRTAAAE